MYMDSLSDKVKNRNKNWGKNIKCYLQQAKHAWIFTRRLNHWNSDYMFIKAAAVFFSLIEVEFWFLKNKMEIKISIKILT